MTKAFQAVGAIAALAFVIVSVTINFKFGLSLGRNPEDAIVFGMVSVASDCLKAILPLIAIQQLRSGTFLPFSCSAFIWSLCLAYSISCSLGFTALNRAMIANKAASQQETVALLREQQASVKQQMDRLSQIPPLHALQKQIADIKSHRRWRMTKQCSEPTLPESIAFCRTYKGIVANISAAEKRQQLEREASSIQRQLIAHAQEKTQHLDHPRSVFIAQLLGVADTSVEIGFSVMLVLLLEIGSGLGFLAIALRNSTATAISDKTSTEPARKPDNPIEEPGELCARFLTQALAPSEGDRVQAAKLYDAFLAWLNAQGHMETVSPNAFGRHLVALVCKKQKKGGTIQYLDVKLIGGARNSA